LEKKQQDVQSKLLISVLGEDVFNQLNQDKKKFLGFIL